MKTAVIQARIEPKLKEDVEKILATMGITASQAIQMFYSSIKLHKGIPFEAKIPNRALVKAMKEVDARQNLHSAKNVDDLFVQFSKKR